MQEIDLGKALAEELARRKEKNIKYSLRSFARDLNLSPSTLSLVISRKRGLSLERIKDLAKILGFSANQRVVLAPRGIYDLLSQDALESMSNWYHMAILSLADLKENKSSAQWISNRLGISTKEAKGALACLLRLGLIEIQGAKLKGRVLNLKTTTDVPSSALRKYHAQNLELASQSLEKVSVEWRDITSMVMPIDYNSLAAAKRDIKKFRRQFCKKYENLKATEVYTLGIQLFPVTRTKWNEDKV